MQAIVFISEISNLTLFQKKLLLKKEVLTFISYKVFINFTEKYQDYIKI